MSAVANVPKLRFTEFSGEWTESRLGEIANIKTGPFGSTLHQEDYSDIGTPIITVEHLGEYAITKQNLPLVSDKDKERLKSYILNAGDIVFSRVGSVDRSSLVSEEEEGWLFSGRLLRVKITSKDYSATFLNQLFKHDHIKHRIRSVAVGQTMPSLNTEILKSFHLHFPTTESEQQKIASFLTAVDSKIEQLTRKRSLLEQYKKGVMQKIFSREIRFRADDGSAFPEWEEKKLGNIGSFKSGAGFPEKEQGGKSGTPFFKVSDMNIIENKSHMTTANNYVTDEQIVSLKLSPIMHDAIIFAKVGAAIFLERKRRAKNFLIDNNMMAFIPNCDIDYITHVFSRIHLSRYAQVGALPSYNASDLKTIKIQLPCEAEQTKIADFLSSIDTKIDFVAKELESARQFKKGLLQQMFV